jgi:hypothetical protein
VFDFFDETGATQSMTPCDILEAANQLNYTYQGEPAQVAQTCGTIPIWVFRYLVLLNIPFPTAPIDGDPYMVPVSLSSVIQNLESILKNADQQVYLTLQGVQTKTQPGVTWEVYMGLPIGVAPVITSPYYVGKLSLFGPGVHNQAHGTFKAATPTFNVTKALRTIVEAGAESAPISFYARGILVDGKPVTPQVLSDVTVASAVLKVGTRSQG